MQEKWETRVRSLGHKNPLEKEIATHSTILAWKIPRTEEPGGLQPIESQRVRHNCVTKHTDQETNTVRANYTCCVPSPIPDERWFFYASLAKTSCCSTSIKILRSQEQRPLRYLFNVGFLGAIEFINPTGDSFRVGRKCNFIPPAEYHMCSEQEKESSTIIFKTFRTNLIFSDAHHEKHH